MSELEQQIRHPSLRRLYLYWKSRCGDRPMPSRNDLDPVDFVYALPGIVLTDVLRDPLRFRLRLVGTAVVRRLGYDLTGRMVDDIPEPDFRRTILDSYSETVREKQPSVILRDTFIDGRPMRYEVLRLPLSADGIDVNMLMTAQEYLF